MIAVCRLDSLDEAADLVDAGDADLVALARPHIADPDLVVNAQYGRRSRTCIACNQACIGRVEQNLPISCVVNPEVGAEGVWRRAWAATGTDRGRRVLVVGGGPAGLQAAVSARRVGDEVTLVERHTELGGQVRLAAQIPQRERIGRLVDDLIADLKDGGVHLELGVVLAADEIDAADWDDVIVATGSTPSRTDFGAGVHVLTTWEAAEQLGRRDRLDGQTVVVFDVEGDWPGASIAEGYATLGAAVHLVSPHPSMFAKITTYSRLGLVHRLRAAAVQVHLLAEPRATGAGEVTLTNTFDASEQRLEGIDLVVDAGRRESCDAIYRQLDAAPVGPRLHVVGDANSPRTALEAVYEGRLAGVFIDDDGPAARLVAS